MNVNYSAVLEKSIFPKIIKQVSLVLILGVAFIVQAAPGDLDTTFNGTGKSRVGFGFGNDIGSSVAVQADGKIVVAGTISSPKVGFQEILRFAVARYNTDGSLDSTFDGDGRVFTVIGSNPNFSSSANAVRIQTDGKIVVAGHAQTNAGGERDFAVVRYNADGSLDQTFDGDGVVTTNVADNDGGNALVIQSDGKIVVVGSAVVRYNVNGTPDTSFGVNAIQTAANGNGATVQADGKIVTTGRTCGIIIFSPCNVTVTRLNLNGSPDTTFGSNGYVVTSIEGSGNAVAIQPGNNTINNPDKIVVAGKTVFDALVIRFNLNGSLDTTFNVNGYLVVPLNSGSDAANAVGFQFSGFTVNRIIIAGYTGRSSSNSDFFVCRLFLNGGFDPTFNGDGIVTTDFGGSDEGKAMTIRSDKILVAGFAVSASESSAAPASEDFALARYNLADGSLDATFDADGKRIDDFSDLFATAKGAAIQSDGKIVIAGGIADFTDRFGVMRLNPDGTLDTTFDADGKVITQTGGKANAVAIQTSDGKIVVAGGANNDFVIVRYNADGSPDSGFGTNGIAAISINAGADVAHAIAIQTDGKILVAGSSVSGSNTDFAVLRLNTNGTPDNSFDTDGKVTTPIGAGNEEGRAIAIQTDGQIIVAGFSSNGANNDFATVRYNANGALDFSFSFDGKVTTAIGAGSDVGNAVAIQAGKVIVAGSSSNGANNDFALLRYNANGSLDNSFGTGGKTTTEIGEEDVANAVTIQLDGKILAAGSSFTGVNTDFAVVRYNSDGSLDNSYGNLGRVTADVSSGDNDFGNAIALDSFGRAVVAGEANGLFGVVRILGDLAPTAAQVSVSGRVLTPIGRGLTNAVVLLTDSFGNTRTARTSTFGYYRFDAVEAGQTFIFEVRSKRHRFAPQVVTVTEDLEELNFTAFPQTVKIQPQQF